MHVWNKYHSNGLSSASLIRALLKTLSLTYSTSFYFLNCLFPPADTGTMMHGHYKCTSIKCVHCKVRYSKPKTVAAGAFCSCMCKDSNFTLKSAFCSKNLKDILHTQSVLCKINHNGKIMWLVDTMDS